MRNMRVSYNRAKAWEGSTGAGSMEGGTVKSNFFLVLLVFLPFNEPLRFRHFIKNVQLFR